MFAIKFCRGDENSFKTPPIRRRRMARLRLCVPGLNYCRKRAFRKLQIAKVNKFRNKTSTIFSGNRVGVLFLFGKTSTTFKEIKSAFYFFDKSSAISRKLNRRFILHLTAITILVLANLYYHRFVALSSILHQNVASL